MRAHLAPLVEGKVVAMVAQAGPVKASLYEQDIADLSGGRLLNEHWRGRPSPADVRLMAERAWKLDYIARKMPRTVTVTFSNIDLPGDPPEEGEIE